MRVIVMLGWLVGVVVEQPEAVNLELVGRPPAKPGKAAIAATQMGQ